VTVPRRSLALVEMSGVSVDFPLYHGSARSLKKTLFSNLAGRVGEDAQHRVVVQALRDVSFRLQPGDRLGLVGHNGAGKTTLLRTLAGIYEPLVGRVRVSGTLGALLDPNLGLNPDLTGRENIFLRGLYAGLPRAEIARLEEDVRDFAELGQFMDLPVRIYSSGMIVRLGFAMATAIRPQVLLMDEWFLAGDAAFMQKARGRLEEMVRGAEILVLSTHQSDVVLGWCTRVLWMDQGRVREDGPTDQVMHRFLGHDRLPLAEGVPESVPGSVLEQPAA
jgi:lipopolysaccharide transport system ATP-binding protein